MREVKRDTVLICDALIDVVMRVERVDDADTREEMEATPFVAEEKSDGREERLADAVRVDFNEPVLVRLKKGDRDDVVDAE